MSATGFFIPSRTDAATYMPKDVTWLAYAASRSEVVYDAQRTTRYELVCTSPAMTRIYDQQEIDSNSSYLAQKQVVLMPCDAMNAVHLRANVG